jgi:predicted transcriptional regulator
MVSIRQVKAARALLGWSQSDLAEKSGVSMPTVARLEMEDGPLGGRPETRSKIVGALERAGIVFTNDGEPGVKIVPIALRESRRKPT